VLLDEPTSQLDPVAGDELIGLLRRLNQEWETTVLLAEHRLERCLAAADRVIALQAGSVACDGDPHAFLEWAARVAPNLQTPGAKLFALAGLAAQPVGVRQARAQLRARGLLDEPSPQSHDARSGGREKAPKSGPLRALRRHRGERAPALAMRGVWHELRNGPSILRGVTFAIERGETVVLMGRNGAGKSTLLRHAAGLLEPTRGRVASAGRVALLLQNPGDYFLHERVGEEAPHAALARFELEDLVKRHPRDLSGGERQRLALAIVAGGELSPSVLCLDEPTRGMDRASKAELAALISRLAAEGIALLVATHDAEFAATFARRVVLLGDGRPVADAPAPELLSGGWYFATETARILGGRDETLLPEAGAELLRQRLTVEVAP
jgi:energy-coupling factor transport system ATP-binding protein